MPIDVKDEVPGAVAKISSARAYGTPAVDFRMPQVADWHAEGGGHIAYYELGEGPEGLAAWICVGGFWVRAEQVGTASRPVTSTPEFLDQCPTPAANLSELVGWHAADNFSGLECNSGSIGDQNYTLRPWAVYLDSQPTQRTAQISSGQYEVTIHANSTGVTDYIALVTLDNYLGEFELIAVIDASAFPRPTNGNSRWGVSLGGWDFHFERDSGAGDLEILQGLTPIGAWVPGVRTVKITRDATNTVRFYVDDVLINTPFVDAVALTNWNIRTLQSNGGATNPSTSMLVQSVSLTDKADGTGGQIYNDPAGTPCS